ncbi:MAG TPA: gluconate 2-dehydrogenase subunit 3 family protein [Chitinophagaceae bacterium]
MNRRNVIRNVIIISTGASLLPACTTTDESTLTLKNIPLTGPQEKMLAELAETIIPKTPGVTGAKELKSHEFLLIMIDDCAVPEQQQLFTSGMKAFEDACRDKFNSPFVKCSAEQKNELLKEMETIKDKNNAAAGFYKTVKRYTIQSFTSSKPFLLDIKKWKMAPGNAFKGCVPV